MPGYGLDARRYSAVTADLTLNYALVRPQLRQSLLPSVTVRAGASLIHSKVNSKMEYYWAGWDYTPTAEFSELTVQPGGVAGVELAFRLSRGASLQVGYEVAVYPRVQEGPLELDDPRINFVIKTVEPRTIDLRRGGVSMGLAVHLGDP